MNVSEHMFANAIHIPGWRHVWDGVLRRSLFSLSWFPKFLEKLKALVSLLRDSNAVDELAEHMLQSGLPGLASAVKSLRLVGLAEWRWSTLGRACKSIRGVLDSLAAHFDPAWTGKHRDKKRAQHVRFALCSIRWMPRYELVTWLSSSLLDPIVTWIGGCCCHEQSLLRGEDVECPRKGRRLKEAYVFAMESLRQGLETASGWTADDFGSDLVLLQEAQGAVRWMVEDGRRRVDVFNQMPWLCARLAEPGIKDRCVALWEAHPPEAHHRVTRSFFSPESELRPLIDAMSPDCTNVDPRLQSQIDSLGACPMDDTVAEAPIRQSEAHQNSSERIEVCVARLECQGGAEHC